MITPFVRRTFQSTVYIQEFGKHKIPRLYCVKYSRIAEILHCFNTITLGNAKFGSTNERKSINEEVLHSGGTTIEESSSKV